MAELQSRDRLQPSLLDRLTDHHPLESKETVEALKFAPILALRGENSDLLSNETLAEMGRRHPDLEILVVPGQGHAPLLLDEPTIARIARFVDRVDPPEKA